MTTLTALRRGGIAAACAFAALGASAQTPPYPDPHKIIQIVAMQPPGSASETMARSWAECAARQLGQPVIVQNKPGANGVLAVRYLESQPRDGYTVMFIGMSQMAITPYIFKKPPYDPQKDFDGIALLSNTSMILTASPGSGIRSLADLARVARESKGQLNFASPGNGSPAHLLTTALADKLGAPMTHVPFVGEAAGMTSLMGNQVQLMTLVLGTAIPQVKAGKIVPLAVLAPQRSALLPDVPALAELMDFKDLERPAWGALVAAAGTPRPAIERLNAVTQQCMADPALRERYAGMSISTVRSTPEDVKLWAARDAQVWRPLIEKLGLVTQ
ncbi:Bug family tripartite tricarboxylate transporter substrate binding protein [Xylophilus sp. ASV27]|uniref:Bug family tripartite tricarboxylate transporter substrate binding protein n=1 Tax=Xylophilus sp. ASV27 TaxID=2795129 RepID=UPI0018EBEEC3|nr:tripartite tricarboxylate transporter substrate binding protein [Xylophilus sp. ASV27]